MSVRSSVSSSTASILVYAQRDRARAMVRALFPRRKHHVILTRTSAAFELAFRQGLIDAAVIDVSAGSANGSGGSGGEETWRVARMATDFPSVPFFGLLSLRASDASALTHCASCEFSDVLIEGVDDAVAREMVSRASFSTRFARALHDPPAALSLSSPLQLATWRSVVASAGQGVRTDSLARLLRVTREHLSRTFAADGGPNLKRVIDLVRLLAAAELAKNPGYDVRDVANVLGFASPSHLSTTSQRIVGTKSASLSRLRTVDLIERFARGHGRSRQQ